MSDYTSWTVGMEVECVDDSHWSMAPWAPLTPRAGDVCTISLISDWRGIVGIQVREIPVQYRDGVQVMYQAKYFRPVAKRPTSIAIFERIRDNPKAPIIEPSPKQRERV